MSVYRLSHQAEEDLNEIADYLANSNPWAADDVIEAFSRHCKRWPQIPGLARAVTICVRAFTSFPPDILLKTTSSAIF